MKHDIEEFWLEEDGNDWAPALERAQASILPTDHIELQFANKLYRFSKKVDLYRGVALIGAASVIGHKSDATPQGGSHAIPTLHFDNKTCGLEIHFPGTYEPEPTARGTVTIRNLVIHGSGHMSGLGLHGIVVHNKPNIEGVTVRQFGGNGIHAYCTGPHLPGGGPDQNPGNCNLMQLTSVRLYLNGGYGLYMNGADANAGIFTALDVNANGQALPVEERAQIWDSSFLGNLYIGFHIGGDQYGSRPFVSDNRNARTLLVSCYVEGIPGLYMAPPAMSIGGFANPATGENSAHVDSDTTGALRVVPSLRVHNKSDAGNVEFTLGSAGVDNVAFELSANQRTPIRMHYERKREGWWELVDANAASLISMALSAHGAPEGRGQIWFPNGYYFGGTGTPRAKETTATRGGIDVVITSLDGADRAVGYAPVVPTTGKWQRGDRIWSSTPTSGEPAGWVCVETGSPGTWAAMSNLAGLD